MIRFLIRLGVFLASAAVGLLVAALLVSGLTITVKGFILVVLIFALMQGLLTPALTQAATRNTPALLGGVGLASTFLSLLVTSLLAGGLTISGFSSWVFATLIIWIVTMLATLFLPMLFVKKKAAGRAADSK